METCPVCRASLNGASTCRRCRADLQMVQEIERRGQALTVAAMQALARGNCRSGALAGLRALGARDADGSGSGVCGGCAAASGGRGAGDHGRCGDGMDIRRRGEISV